MLDIEGAVLSEAYFADALWHFVQLRLSEQSPAGPKEGDLEFIHSVRSILILYGTVCTVCAPVCNVHVQCKYHYGHSCTFYLAIHS